MLCASAPGHSAEPWAQPMACVLDLQLSSICCLVYKDAAIQNIDTTNCNEFTLLTLLDPGCIYLLGHQLAEKNLWCNRQCEVRPSTCEHGIRADAVCHCVQGCVEIIYISVQVVMYTMIVYWMCWFQRDAGEQAASAAASATAVTSNAVCDCSCEHCCL